MSAPFRVGSTGVVVLVPESEPLVARLRARYDGSAAWGMPAHVTVLFPWLPAAAPQARADLRHVAAGIPAFDAELSDVGRFPQTVWLKPTPTASFLALTEAVWARWPEAACCRCCFTGTTPIPPSARRAAYAA